MMKKIISMILSAALLGILVISLTACGSKKEPETTTAAATEAAAEEKSEAPAEEETKAPAEEKTEAPAEEKTEAPAEEETEAPAEEETEAPAEEETEAPAEEETEAVKEDEKADAAGDAITVAFEDFDAQEALSKSIQNMEVTGNAVEIEGISRQIGTKYSIGQVKDGKFIGTNYTFDGEYPAEDAHIILKGTVVQDGFVCTISAESIEVVE